MGDNAVFDLDTQPICKQNICFADNFNIAVNSLKNQFGTVDGFNQSEKLMLFGVDDWKSAKDLEASFQTNKFSELELFGCQLHENAYKGLAAGLKKEAASRISKLDIDNSPLSQQAVRTIMEAVSESNNLQTLNLQGSVKETESVRAFAAALATNQYIQKVDLKINEINETGAEAIAEMLKHNKTICEIDMFYNNIGPAGAASIANALARDQCALIKLNLCCNNISDEGAIALGQMLTVNRTLEELHLALNDIKDDGANAIFSALSPLQDHAKMNTVLRILDMSANNIKNGATDALCSLITHNTTMEELDFTGIEPGVEGWDTMQASFISHSVRSNQGTNVPLLRFSIVDVDEDSLQGVEDSLKDNQRVEWKRKD